MIEVRPARIEDAGAIARVWVDAWQVAYRGIVPAGVLDELSVPARTERWQRRLATEDATRVAVLDGAVVGYCRAFPERGEIASLYVRPTRRGIGTALLTAVLADFRGPATLWLLAPSHGARAFYERFGFVPDGAEQVDPGTGVLEIRMARP